jgi:hypothetical protein
MTTETETPRLTSVVFRLTRQKLAALKQLSRDTRVRQSEYLREAIEDVLQKYEAAGGYFADSGEIPPAADYGVTPEPARA